MKYLIVLLLGCLTADGKLLLTGGQGYNPAIGLASPAHMRVFENIPFAGRPNNVEVADIQGGQSIEVDLSDAYATNNSLTLDFQYWEPSQSGILYWNEVEDTGYINVYDGDSVGFDCGVSNYVGSATWIDYSDGSYYNPVPFYQAHGVLPSMSESGGRLIAAGATGLSAGCVLWWAVAGFSFFRSIITEK